MSDKMREEPRRWTREGAFSVMDGWQRRYDPDEDQRAAVLEEARARRVDRLRMLAARRHCSPVRAEKLRRKARM